MNNFKKYLIGSFGFHVGALVVAIVASFVVATPQSQKINLANNDAIPAMTEKQLMESVAVSEAELAASLSQYEQRTKAREAEYNNRLEAVNKAEKALSEKNKEISKSQRELQMVNKNLAEMREQARRLKAQQEHAVAEDKKKRADEIVQQEKLRKAKVAEKNRIEAERKEEELVKRRLAAQKEANKKALREIAARNKAAEERELALIRGKYEDDIHNLLYDAWMLPYDRQNVHCSVALNLAPDGSIINFSFQTECPSGYKQMIDLAIQRVNKLPRVPDKIFKSTEVVNFIDVIK
ncbi:hypothetical protein OTK49_00445 [Vibrio coralliirubri]|uniref:hypothetical protein n=1 Tax=Vibrio coralliirubri TaxID=1516159 RepID=UPI0022834FC2|nr:hypothetical protein [Vibrio coralliirubri]MCY9861010.1 hypothetical protein [Vibrio coralliirubri]